VPKGTTDMVVIDSAKDEENIGDLVSEPSLLEGGETCVDVLQGSEIEGKAGKKKEVKEKEEEEGSDNPTK